MFRVYIWIDGNGFDPDQFQGKYGASLGGTVHARKKMRDGAVEISEKYWKSEVLEPISAHPEDELNRLMVKLKPALLSVKNIPNVRVVAEIVEEVGDVDSMSGFFFSDMTIQLLAEVGACVDIDLVRRVTEQHS